MPVAGSTLPLDRNAVAADLGLSGVTENSMDAVSDHDYFVDIVSASANTMVHLSRLSEEHGHFDASGTEIDAGMKIEIVPSHNDTTINLHSEYYVMRGDEVIAIWPIEAARAYR